MADKTFGDNLSKSRKKAGLSQEELAGRLSVTRQTISKWELDQSTPELALLAQISDIFGITTDYLIKDAPAEAASAAQDPSAKKPAARLALFIILLCIGGRAGFLFFFGGLFLGNQGEQADEADGGGDDAEEEDYVCVFPRKNTVIARSGATWQSVFPSRRVTSLCFRRGRRLPTVVPTDSRPLSWPPIGALPRNRLASSATGGASPVSLDPKGAVDIALFSKV